MNVSVYLRSRVVLAVLVFVLGTAGSLFAQPETEIKLRGSVTDKTTGDPIPFAHIYISQSTAGTIANENGEFELVTNLTGNRGLVFSSIGYQPQIFQLYLGNGQPVQIFDIEMEPDVYEMSQLEVTDTVDTEWQQNLKIFQEQFIGTSHFSYETEITNPWVIGFDKDENGNLTAYAQQPVLVANHALGYEKYIDLIEFYWNRNTNYSSYSFYALYHEMEPQNSRDQRKWQRNRINAYTGSFEHFLFSLYRDELLQNRFETVNILTENPVQIQQISDYEVRRIIIQTSGVLSLTRGDIKGFRMHSPVDVFYGRKTRHQDQRVRSRITPMTDSGIFLVTQEGRLFDPQAVRLDGVWSTHRVGDLLPVDYFLED